MADDGAQQAPAQPQDDKEQPRVKRYRREDLDEDGADLPTAADSEDECVYFHPFLSL